MSHFCNVLFLRRLILATVSHFHNSVADLSRLINVTSHFYITVSLLLSHRLISATLLQEGHTVSFPQHRGAADQDSKIFHPIRFFLLRQPEIFF